MGEIHSMNEEAEKQIVGKIPEKRTSIGKPLDFKFQVFYITLFEGLRNVDNKKM
jgi:hypothetical protein